MILCNLNVLLAKRQLKISRVYNDTGISRSTLTALASGEPKGIQFDTINTLCKYLKITPSDLFLYSPIDINVTLGEIICHHSLNDFYEVQDIIVQGSVFLNFDTPNGAITNELKIDSTIHNGQYYIFLSAIDETNRNYEKILESLDDNFIVSISQNIKHLICQELSHYIVENNISFNNPNFDYNVEFKPYLYNAF
jgi:hypothetical protein